MNIYRDRQIRLFHLFLFGFSFSLLLAGLLLCRYQTFAAGQMLLSHDEALVTSLLQQDIAPDIIAKALTSTEGSTAGSRFLTMIGITADRESRLLPFYYYFQQKAVFSVCFCVLCLSLFLFGGARIFLWKREILINRSADVINDYIKGDYSSHLPQTQEGAIYRLFASIEELSALLRAKSENERKTKEFLKNTISDISHQLKTPLAALFMYQEIMENEPDQADVIREFTKKTGISLKRMDQLIQTMLKITRIDAGNVLFIKERCPVAELISRSLAELSTRAGKEHKSLLYEASDETLLCDPVWTGEAIANLVKNALDHINDGGVIQITCKSSPTSVNITVTDNGNGIAQEDIYHIFKRFYRSKNSKDTQGVGLGLPLAKSIAEGQGGTISVHSVPQEGTSFTLSFPAAL